MCSRDQDEILVALVHIYTFDSELNTRQDSSSSSLSNRANIVYTLCKILGCIAVDVNSLTSRSDRYGRH